MKMLGQELLETAPGLEKPPGMCWIETILSQNPSCLAPGLSAPAGSYFSHRSPGSTDLNTPGQRHGNQDMDREDMVTPRNPQLRWTMQRKALKHRRGTAVFTSPCKPPYPSCSGRLWSFLTWPPTAQTRQINSNTPVLVSRDSFL